jgi:hypothetical protein
MPAEKIYIKHILIHTHHLILLRWLNEER